MVRLLVGHGPSSAPGRTQTQTSVSGPSLKSRGHHRRRHPSCAVWDSSDRSLGRRKTALGVELTTDLNGPGFIRLLTVSRTPSEG